MAVQVHSSMARAIQPFSTGQDGDTLYRRVDTGNRQRTRPLTLTTIAGETMWDAVLASVPDNAVSARPAEKPASVSADKLAAYAGTYEFGSAAAGGGSAGSASMSASRTAVKVVPIAGLSAPAPAYWPVTWFPSSTARRSRACPLTGC